MKIAGVIGGFGPETTAEFYMAVIKGCQEQTDDQPPILIQSVPAPYSLHERLIVKVDNSALEEMKSYLQESAKWLEKGGAEFIVMPCNTLHAIIDDIRAAVNIPVLSIIEQTVNAISNGSIGLVATTMTAKLGLYQEAFKQQDVKMVLPTTADQALVDEIIDRLVKNEHREQDSEEFMKCIGRLEAETVLLACTDLQLLLPKHPSIKIKDTMQILADATVKEILK